MNPLILQVEVPLLINAEVFPGHLRAGGILFEIYFVLAWVDTLRVLKYNIISCASGKFAIAGHA